MCHEEGESRSGGAASASLDEAVDALAGDGADRGPETVRATLSVVAEDGVVSAGTVESALAHASKVVATPETRVELALIEFAEAREAAEPVADLAAVNSRLDAFDARLSTIEERVVDLGAELQEIPSRPDDLTGIYKAAAAIRDIEAAATEAQRAADELTVDIEEFEDWLDDPAARCRAIEGDADAVAATLDDLDDAIDGLATVDDGDETDRAAVWADAILRHRVVELLLADVRAELADLRAWHDREGIDDDGRLNAIADRLDDLEARLATLGDRLDDLARPGWRTRHDDRLAAFEDTIANVEPPVSWRAVQAALDEHRPAGGDTDAA